MPKATTIGKNAFWGCSALTTVSLPEATGISRDAFYNCSSLTSFFFGNTPPEVDSNAIVGNTPTSATYYYTGGDFDSFTMRGHYRTITRILYTPGDYNLTCAPGSADVSRGDTAEVTFTLKDKDDSPMPLPLTYALTRDDGVTVKSKVTETAKDEAQGQRTVTVSIAVDEAYGKLKLTATAFPHKAATTTATLTVIDTNPPTVDSVTPDKGATDVAISGDIVITFDEAIGETGTVSLDGGAGSVIASGAWSTTTHANDTYTIGYSGLAWETEYTINIAGFKDTAGNEMAENKVNSFTTIKQPDGPGVSPQILDIITGQTGTFTISLGQSGNEAEKAELSGFDSGVISLSETSVTADTAITVTGVSAGTTQIKVKFSGGTAASTELYVDVTVTDPHTSGGGSATPETGHTVNIRGVDVPYTIDSNGKAILTPTKSQTQALLKAKDNDGVLTIAISSVKGQPGYIEGVKSVVIEIDLTLLPTDGSLSSFVFTLDGLSIEFPLGALMSMKEKASVLRYELKPGSLVFALTDKNGKKLDWYDHKNPVTLSMAYTPAQDISGKQLVIVMADKTVIPRSWYTATEGETAGVVSAKVHTTGTYDVAVKPLGCFTDTQGLWMDTAVSYMAPRGIVEGIGGSLFNPQGAITRAEFITMLMRSLGVEVPETREIPTADYDSIPDWAKQYVLTAEALGMSLSDEIGNFNPSDVITRQDMFLYAYEAINACGMLPDAYTDQFIVFADWDGVNVEASEPIQNLAKLKLVNGNGNGVLNPNGTSTRAEGVQFLYNVLTWDAGR